MKHPRARTKQKRGLKTVATQNMNKSPQGIKTSVSGKHFKPSLKLIRMRPRTASNHCKHRQPQTSENHEQNRLKAASNPRAPQNHHASNTRLAAPRNHAFNQQANLNRPTNQAANPSTDRPTDRPQPISPTCQPTNQPASQPVRPTCGARALKPTPRKQATCRLPKLEPPSKT